MPDNPSCFRWEEDELLLFIKIQPGANRDEWVDQTGECCRIRIAAPPVEGKANQRLVNFLAKQFGVSKNKVLIERGAAARLKHVRIMRPKKLRQLFY